MSARQAAAAGQAGLTQRPAVGPPPPFQEPHALAVAGISKAKWMQACNLRSTTGCRGLLAGTSDPKQAQLQSLWLTTDQSQSAHDEVPHIFAGCTGEVPPVVAYEEVIIALRAPNESRQVCHLLSNPGVAVRSNLGTQTDRTRSASSASSAQRLNRYLTSFK